jgi:hypothetical protein
MRNSSPSKSLKIATMDGAFFRGRGKNPWFFCKPIYLNLNRQKCMTEKWQVLFSAMHFLCGASCGRRLAIYSIFASMLRSRPLKACFKSSLKP